MDINNMDIIFKQLLDDSYQDEIIFNAVDGNIRIYKKEGIIAYEDYLYALLTMLDSDDNNMYFYKMIIDDEKIGLELIVDDDLLEELTNVYMLKYDEFDNNINWMHIIWKKD